MVASGFNMVSALAIAVAAGDTASYDEAVRLLDSREGFSFAWGGAVSESTSRLDLARAALALGRTDEARAHLEPIASRRYEARAMIEGMDAARDH